MKTVTTKQKHMNQVNLAIMDRGCTVSVSTHADAHLLHNTGEKSNKEFAMANNTQAHATKQLKTNNDH